MKVKLPEFKSVFKSENDYLNVFILGIITATIIFLPFVIADKGLFLYYGDFNVQQIPFYRLAHEALRDGASGWSWTTDLGANFIGSYAFYLLGSPFFWLTYPFPLEWVPYMMAPLLVLKFGCSTVTSYAFIKRFTQFNKTAMIGALMYAFCGFNIYNIFFNHFNEVVVLFPLLLIALEELVINNRRGAFALVVALCAVTNYYFFFGEVIFVLIYFIVRCTDKNFTANFKKFLLIAFESVIGLLLSAVLLLPAIFAISGNTRLNDFLLGYDMVIYNNAQRYGLILSSFFFPPDMPARPNFFPAAEAKWSSVSMFLPLLSMSGVFAFFRGAKQHWAKKLIGICVVFAFVPVLNSMFSAFNYAYYARWFFMPLLIMAMVSCIALEKYNKHMKFGIIVNAIFVAGFMMIGILPKKIDDKIQMFKMPEYPERFWGYVGVAIAGLLVTYLLYIMSIKYRHFFKVAIASVCCLSIVYSCFMLFLGRLSGDGYETIANKALTGEQTIHLNENYDMDFYRIDTFDELDNLGMYWNKPTINAFHSIVPSGVMEYYQKIGGERGVGSRPKPNLIGVRALNSVKFSFTSEDKDPPQLLGFDYHDTQNGYKIYKNKYYIPMGFTYDKIAKQSDFEGYANANKDRLLLETIVVPDEDFEQYTDILPTFDYGQSYSDIATDNGYFAACEKLKENSAHWFSIDSRGFSSEINTTKSNLVFYSVPYEDGWSATVNGAHTQIVKANLGFMAVKVPAGESLVRFEYKTPGLKAGSGITIIALMLLAAYLIIIEHSRQKTGIVTDRSSHRAMGDYSVDIVAHEAYIDKCIQPPIVIVAELPPTETAPPELTQGESQLAKTVSPTLTEAELPLAQVDELKLDGDDINEK